MDPYTGQYVSIIPRILPSQYSSKKIPMNEEVYPSVETYSNPGYINSNNAHQITPRNDYNYQDNNQYYNNHIDNPSKRRNSLNRLHVEPLKDTSGDLTEYNSSSGYIYPHSIDYKSTNHFKENSSNQSIKIFLIIFGIIIALFALTALAISIYLLIKMSTTTTTSG